MERTKESFPSSKKKVVLLSFDVEECDIPCEYGTDLTLSEQLSLTDEGLENLLSVIEAEGASPTFYTTATYALHAPAMVQKLSMLGEVASHGYYHTGWEESHLTESVQVLENITGKAVQGFRMPRMANIPPQVLQDCGISYNASSNPTWIPGRYCALTSPRRPHIANGITQVPASVTPIIRFPLFWISAHVLPLSWYWFLVRKTLQHDGYIHLYFHPWEFNNALQGKEYGLPKYLRSRCGEPMVNILRYLIRQLHQQGCIFQTTFNFLQHYEFGK